MKKKEKIKVGISTGDLNGIGLELIIKTFEDRRVLDFCTPIIFGSSKVFYYHKKVLNSEIQVQIIKSLDNISDGKLNIINVWKEDVEIELGTPTKNSGIYALKSLETATEALKLKKINTLLTAPISKNNIQSESFEFVDHTKYLESKLEGNSLMMFITEDLKLGLITTHIPVSKISETITEELIYNKVEIMYNTLVQDFGIIKPKIAVLGLNPHCGEHGLMGDEDDTLIASTLLEIQKNGKLVYGPYAADGFFGSREYKNFDGVMAMYHDQGLVAFKTIAFGNGVNFTAGLSEIRTSPDHGTAFEITGKNQANTSSFNEALHTGLKIFKTRENYNKLTKNSLKVKKHAKM